MKTFVGTRREDGTTRVFVDDSNGNRLKRLFHREGRHSHSPDGFEWGYAGSGPSELAWAIAADILKDRHVPPNIYQRLKQRVIVGLDRDKWMLREDVIREHLQEIIAEIAAESTRVE